MGQMMAPQLNLADQFLAKENLIGVILKMPSPASVELVGGLGFDFVIIDTEHGPAGGSELDNHIRAADAAGIPVVVRVSTLSRTEIQRALDGGAAGVVVPQVDTAAMAEEAVRLAHYPPFGARGLATSTRAGRQGTVPTAKHLARARKETIVIVQIESRAGVSNADAILAVEGVSAVWLGLSDLTLDLGHFGEYTHPDVASAIDYTVCAAKRADIPFVIIADSPSDGAHWIDRGAQVLLVNVLTVLSRGLAWLKNAHHSTMNERKQPQP
ncbi:aldolase/citrate lyase family protein [Microbacterium sp. X-17]|uniref:HpcH/HpaI aldolase family protein n=1 Tax=Microbacterium sp. X-17 TaxID=3144404 RepID=UPI0031F5417D